MINKICLIEIICDLSYDNALCLNASPKMGTAQTVNYMFGAKVVRCPSLS